MFGFFQKLRKKKLNNKGLSLVELIISVTILSITIAPLMYAFVRSSMINRQASIKQRATYAAQQIMENFKAYDLTTDPDRPAVPSVSSLFVSGGEFLNSQDSVCTYDQSIDANGYGSYKINGFTFSDGAYASDEPVRYDAVITVEEGAVNTGLSAANTQEELLTLDYMDSTYDGVFLGNEDDSLVMNTLQNEISDKMDEFDYISPLAAVMDSINLGDTWAPVHPVFKEDLPIFIYDVDSIKLKRTMSLGVGTTGSISYLYEYSAKVKYYTITQDPFGYNVVVEATSPMEITGESFTVSVPSVSGSPTRNMYYFYYPLYSTGDYSQIKIPLYKEPGDLPMDSDPAMAAKGFLSTSFDLATWNQANTTITLDSVEDVLEVSGSCENLFIYKQKSAEGTSTSESLYKLSGTRNSANLYSNLYKNIYEYNSTTGEYSDLTVSHPFAAKSDMNDYKKVSEDTQTIYSIKVEVWESGKTDPADCLVSMTGTRVQKVIK